jgi:hypothetical protein
MGSNLFPQLRDPLGGSIFVEPLFDPGNAFFFERFRDIEIGFADAQIDGIFHLTCQIEDSPHSGGLDIS